MERELTPHFSVLSYMSCVNLTQLYTQSTALAGIPFKYQGNDSTSCPYRRSVAATTPAAQAAVVYGFVCMSVTLLDSWGSGAVEIATRKVTPPGSVELTESHPSG